MCNALPYSYTDYIVLILSLESMLTQALISGKFKEDQEGRETSSHFDMHVGTPHCGCAIMFLSSHTPQTSFLPLLFTYHLTTVLYRQSGPTNY